MLRMAWQFNRDQGTLPELRRTANTASVGLHRPLNNIQTNPHTGSVLCILAPKESIKDVRLIVSGYANPVILHL